VRRVQLTGHGSYIVSLPKAWVEEAGLKKGGQVQFSRQQQQLVLTPFDAVAAEDERMSCSTTVSPDTKGDSLARKIISLYIVGFTTIQIDSETGNLPASVRDVIRETARNKLVGTEVVTESSRSVLLQVLLTSPQLMVTDVLRRMGTIAISMLQDSITALSSLDAELAKQIVKTDDEIDRFSIYIIRQLKLAVQHPSFLERVGLASSVECLAYRITTKSIERSADHAARIARNSLLIRKQLERNLVERLKTLSQQSSEMMDNALKALFASDYQLAENVLQGKEGISALERRFVEHLLRQRLPAGDLSAVRLISESLLRIGEYATDIAEVVLNLTVRKSVELRVGPSPIET